MAHSSDIHVGKAVVVVISHGNAHAVALPFEAGLLRHVRKSPVAVITIEPIPIFWIRFVGSSSSAHRILQCSAIDEKQIQQSILVVIDHGHAAHHGFRQIFTRCVTRMVNEGNLRALRYINKLSNLSQRENGKSGGG